MKAYLNGLILTIQFFSIFPIRKEVQMTDKNMNGLILALPFFGLVLGVVYSGITYLLVEVVVLSSLMITFVLWLLAIILTGAIHLDGWMDASDAFFSYRDKQRRLEIMEDPHIGAFGVISAIVLLATKFIFIYEVVLQLEMLSYLLILLIPFFSRILTGMMLVLVPAAKKAGLGFFFQQATKKRSLGFYFIYFISIAFLLSVWRNELLWVFLLLLLFTLGSFLFLRKKVLRWFGGMTGDVIGASQEGLEVGLWMIVWLLHFFVMG